jgi:hypothetical protein
MFQSDPRNPADEVFGRHSQYLSDPATGFSGSSVRPGELGDGLSGFPSSIHPAESADGLFGFLSSEFRLLCWVPPSRSILWLSWSVPIQSGPVRCVPDHKRMRREMGPRARDVETRGRLTGGYASPAPSSWSARDSRCAPHVGAFPNSSFLAVASSCSGFSRCSFRTSRPRFTAGRALIAPSQRRKWERCSGLTPSRL